MNELQGGCHVPYPYGWRNTERKSYTGRGYVQVDHKASD